MPSSYAVVSPLARRIRLGAEIRALRGETTATEIARKARLDRTVISKVESGERRASLDTILRILDALPIERGGREYQELLAVARDGLERGWWQDAEYEHMGDRQARTADLECGATIREYQTSMLPGLLQTEAYTRHRGLVVLAKGADFDLEATTRGRMRRQEQVLGPTATNYEVVLEPQAIWRRPVPPGVMHEQLHHLHKLATEAANITVRILPVDAQLGDGWVPRNPFAVYDYADSDLTLVAVDTVSTDLVLTSLDDTAGYAQMYCELRNAALSPEESVELIQQAVNKLAADV